MKSKNNSDIDQEQIELLEYAQSRIKQKKNLYYHFVLFLFISIISLTLNHIFSISNNFSFLSYSWSFWLIFSWFFLFLFHVFNVYVTNRFMSKSWVRKQKSNLIKLQKLTAFGISEIESEISKSSRKSQYKQHVCGCGLSENDIPPKKQSFCKKCQRIYCCWRCFSLSHLLKKKWSLCDASLEREIKSFLAERYSSYILYEPPVNTQNLILWLGPFAFVLILGFFLLRRYIK